MPHIEAKNKSRNRNTANVSCNLSRMILKFVSRQLIAKADNIYEKHEHVFVIVTPLIQNHKRRETKARALYPLEYRVSCLKSRSYNLSCIGLLAPIRYAVNVVRCTFSSIITSLFILNHPIILASTCVPLSSIIEHAEQTIFCFFLIDQSY